MGAQLKSYFFNEKDIKNMGPNLFFGLPGNEPTIPYLSQRAGG